MENAPENELLDGNSIVKIIILVAGIVALILLAVMIFSGGSSIDPADAPTPPLPVSN